jgi:hypothetical protein
MNKLCALICLTSQGFCFLKPPFQIAHHSFFSPILINLYRGFSVPKVYQKQALFYGLAAESIGIDSESFLFSKLNEYKDNFSSLISRRQYNDRRKLTIGLCNQVRERIASKVDGGEAIFCIDSMPIEVCRPIRSKRCKMERIIMIKLPIMAIVLHRVNIITDINYILSVG